LWASLQSARVAHTQVLVQALFWTGTLVAAARLLGLPLTRTVALLALWMFAIEVTQQWVPGQLADITPVLFPVFWWWLWGRWLASPSSLHL
jgi:hypothetical protein